LLEPRYRFGNVAVFSQDCAPQSVELRLIVALAGRCGGCGRSVQCGERITELTGLNLRLCEETKPLGIEQSGTGPVPARQTDLKLPDPLRLMTKADESKPPTHGSEAEHVRQAMLGRDLNGRVGPHSRSGELAPPVVENCGEARCDCDAVGLSEALAKIQGCSGYLQSLVRVSKEPLRPGQICSTKDTGVLSIEQCMGTVFGQVLDRSIQRDAALELLGCIRQKPK
jgi:hypothetical protein